MREIKILFRGKRIDNGEWVYGWLGSLHCSNSQTKEIESVYFTEISEGFDCRLNVIVDYKTVGQYTGLTDKNGVRIFEGDIVHCVSKLDSADMVIIFECGQFRMILAEKYHEYQTNVGYYDINCFAKEVIGNIHDNPELLGGENNGINR